MSDRFGYSWALSLAVILLAGCAEQSSGPQVASSTSQVGYAANYPSVLERVTQEAQAQRKLATDTSTELSKFPEALKDPNWQLVEQIYTQAVAEGQGEAFATRFEESAVVNRFFTEEKKAIGNRVAGSAQRAAKEKGCEVELHGPTTWGLEKAIEKQLEERLRAESEAHALIEAHEKELGPGNVQTLQTQADRLSVASYVVHLRAEYVRSDLAALNEQLGDVRTTLGEAIEQEQGKPEPNKARIAQLEGALDQLEAAGPVAEEALKAAETENQAALDQFEKAVDALIENVRSLASQQKK